MFSLESHHTILTYSPLTAWFLCMFWGHRVVTKGYTPKFHFSGLTFYKVRWMLAKQK